MESDDVGRIAFVTRRFGELQGLIAATEGAGLLAAAALAHYGFAPSGIYFLPLMLIGGMAGGTFPYLTQLYRESYGAVSPRERIGRMPAVLWLVQLGIIADAFVAVKWGPSAGAVAVTTYAVLIVVRDAPWRLHYLVVVAAGLAAIAFSTAVPGASGPCYPADPALAPAWFATFLFLTSAALTVQSLLDLWMTRRSPAALRGAHADTL